MKKSTKAVILGILFPWLVGGGLAFAQPAPSPSAGDSAGGGAGSDRPDHGFAPPSDEAPPPSDDKPPLTAESPETATSKQKPVDSVPAIGEGSPGAGHDPTTHFNFAHDFWSYHSKDEYGGPLGDGKMVDPATGEVVRDATGGPAEEEPMSPPFVFMLFNFALLLGILIWKGKPPIQQLAAERHDQIASALAEAKKLRDDAAAKLAEYEAKLKDADTEINNMVAGMKKDAEADKLRILEAAERQSVQMKKDAEQRIAAEIEMARAVLTREVTAAAAAATEKLLREKMQPGDQSKLVTSFISNLQERA